MTSISMVDKPSLIDDVVSRDFVSQAVKSKADLDDIEEDQDDSCCCFTNGELCPNGVCGVKKCFGHDVKRFEPKWFLKALLIYTELKWAVSLQAPAMLEDDFTNFIVRPMAWCAWNSMMLATTIQFCNRMCLGQNKLVDGMTMFLDLIFDDIVQLTALGLFWTHGAGFGKGDHNAAVFAGVLALFFAFHNLFALCSSGRKSCWGKGWSRDSYVGKDHVDEAWCPFCTPGTTLSSCANWFCELCPRNHLEPCCGGLCATCYGPMEKDATKKECNLMCCDFSFKSRSKDGLNGCKIFCWLVTNTWIMALWGVHVGSIMVFLWSNHAFADNPYPDWTVWLAFCALIIGALCLMIAYCLEWKRARWLALYGAEGELHEDREGKVRTETDFRYLNHFMLAIVLINLFGSLVPWIAICGAIMQQDGVSGISVAVCLQVFLFGIMSIWEICTRELGICKTRRIRVRKEIRKSVGLGLKLDEQHKSREDLESGLFKESEFQRTTQALKDNLSVSSLRSEDYEVTSDDSEEE